MPLPVTVCFLVVGFIIMAWIAIAPRPALLALFFHQRAVRELDDGRVRVLRGLAAVVALSLLFLLARWAIAGVAP